MKIATQERQLIDIVNGASQLHSNPFITLTFIVAPAILTNASALMVMSTSNRFARAVDRARDLSRQIEVAKENEDTSLPERLSKELILTEERAVLLLKGIRSFYFSLGGFAFAALVSLVGAGLVNVEMITLYRILGVVAVVAFFLAVGGLVAGSMLLFYETRITVGILQERIREINETHQLRL